MKLLSQFYERYFRFGTIDQPDTSSDKDNTIRISRLKSIEFIFHLVPTLIVEGNGKQYKLVFVHQLSASICLSQASQIARSSLAGYPLSVQKSRYINFSQLSRKGFDQRKHKVIATNIAHRSKGSIVKFIGDKLP